MNVYFLTPIVINPAAPLPPVMADTHLQNWVYIGDIIHPETQTPIVCTGDTVDTCSLCMLVDAGADEVTVVRTK